MERRRDIVFDQERAFRDILTRTLAEVSAAQTQAPERPLSVAMPGGMVEANPNTAKRIIEDLKAVWGNRYPDLFTDFSEQSHSES